MKIKRFLTLVACSLIPLALYSCSENTKPQEPERPLTPQEKREALDDKIREIGFHLERVTTEHITFKSFIPEKWDTKTFKEVRETTQVQKVFNESFFKDYKNKKGLDLIEISTRQDFENLIIKRFKEIHNYPGINITDEDIKESFESFYLKNQDVYKVLDTKNIYIDTSLDGWWEVGIIFFIDDNTITINYVMDPHGPPAKPGVSDTSVKWAVFSLPKNKEIIEKTFYPTIEKSFEQNAQEYIDWYNNKFKKYYN